MKIVLVFPPFFYEPMYNLPPLGLVNIASVLKNTHHKIVILDFVFMLRTKELEFGKNLYSKCSEIILGHNPDIVGFSAQCTTYPPVIQIAGLVKANKPLTKIIVGGHNASFVDRLTLENYPWIDAIVRGEGEITFKELVTAYDTGDNEKNVSGVTFRSNTNIVRNQDRDLIKDLDSLPQPDYGFVPHFSIYRDACNLPRSIAILEVGRGCPHNCIYCSESRFWRRQSRTFSVDRLIQEMQNLHEKFGADCFLLAYDQFTAKKKFVNLFCEKVIEKGLNKIPWYCISRLDTVDSHLLELMRKAGCESMCYGIDSGSKKTLFFIQKNIDNKLLYKRVKETANQGIIPTLSFIIGFPDEEIEDIDATLQLALKTGILGNINPLIQMPTILPGTKLYTEYGKNLVREVDTYFSAGIEFQNGKRLESDEDMINQESLIFSSFYNIKSKSYSSEKLNLITSYFPLLVNLYPKTFLLSARKCNQSISGLFFKLIEWVSIRMKRDDLALYPQDLYMHFSSFIEEKVLKKNDVFKITHLNDLLKYETLGIEAGKYDLPLNNFHIDLNMLKKFKPQLVPTIVLGKFEFDLPEIINDLKSGYYDKTYDNHKTILVFTHRNGQSNITQINEFGHDLLLLCNGQQTVEHITSSLAICYGSHMNNDDFFKECLEAVDTLGHMGFIN